MKSAIAIVGMAGRFPGARNVAQFWQNLRNGVEAVRDLSDTELLAAGVTAEELANPAYVRRASILDDIDKFDASFFGFSPRDASIMDPQHRQFLECAWEAMEDAAHPPQRFEGAIGVFAGSGLNSYLIYNLLANRKMVESAGLFQLKQTGNDKDVLATRLSYQFDLRGPSINIQTACSTSLVAVHLASQSLLNFECDMALAGGVTIEIPHGRGYPYREGEILSRDGHCRSFDASSSGTIFGSGLGIVVLRRLEDALASGDHIRAVILGSAINNDGSRKVGFLAPSVEGQTDVIREALEFAGVSPAEISYVETHGTGTVVGDPIEVRALTQAFRQPGTQANSCAIGSVKSNIGHLDAAAGVTGLIKTTLALENAEIPPSLHFESLNPRIDLSNSPFFVNDKLREWQTNAVRRAGVTSLGIGGTNAHVVLEEAPKLELQRKAKPYELLTVSAKSSAAADAAFTNLVKHLGAHPEQNLADVAWTCQVGRQAFAHRRAYVIENSEQARITIAEKGARASVNGTASSAAPSVAFMFSGQGSQYAGMGRGLYEHEPVFRETLDRCARLLKPHLGIDLIPALYPAEEEKDAAAEKLNETWLTQPALFAIEYSLAKWWMSLGVEPAAMAGHSIGEYVAACLAGVFTLEDALATVAERGRLIYALPAGSMLAVPIAADKLDLDHGLSLAAINNPELCVVSGPAEEIAAFEQKMASQSIACRKLHTSHAFHSSMMDPILGAFEERVRGITLRAPQRPYLSNVTGTWIKPEEATDPAYWARHIRQAVRFSDCLAELLRVPDQVVVEAGPGNVLTSLARAQGGISARAYQSLPHPRESAADLRCALQSVGHLWAAGVEIEWTKLRPDGSAARVSLPTYPFEHQRFWVEPDHVKPAAAIATVANPRSSSSGLHTYRRVWKPEPVAPVAIEGICVLFRDDCGLAEELAGQLKAEKRRVLLVEAGTHFKRAGKDRYIVRPNVREDYDELLKDIAALKATNINIFHLWSVTSGQKARNGAGSKAALERSFFSPLYIAQALVGADIARAKLLLASNQLQQVVDEAVREPERAVLLGPAGVISKEVPGIVCGSFDVESDGTKWREGAKALLVEMGSLHAGQAVAWRGGKRFVEASEEYEISGAMTPARLERGGVYLITGGLGALGLAVAEQLAREFKARLVLVGRTFGIPEAQWESFVDDPNASSEDKAKVKHVIEIRSLAGGLLVLAADVTDAGQMRSVVQTAGQRFGRIDGVFHAAGVLEDGPLATKTPEGAMRVLDPKVRGTLALEDALGATKLKCLVLFSSISSIAPPAGQVDYAAANAFLDAFARSRKAPVVAINWDAWREIGMAARSSVHHPMLEKRLRDTPDELICGSQLTLQKHWLLSEHRLKTGAAIAPGTSYMEMAAGTFAASRSRGPVELRDVFFLAPLALQESEHRELRVQLKREAAGTAERFKFSVFAQGSKEDSGPWTEHSTGSIGRPAAEAKIGIDGKAIAARCTKGEILFDSSHRTRQEEFFNFGPRWRCLRRLRVGEGEGLAEIEIEARFAAECASFQFHPAMLDLATGSALYLIDGYGSNDALYLPLSYKKLSSYRPLPAKFFSHIRPRQENKAGGDVATFDLTLFDERDEVLAEIEGFAMRRIENPSAVGEEAVPPTTVADQVLYSDPAEAWDTAGIATREGVQALMRILKANTPNSLIVTKRDLAERPSKETEAAAVAAGSAASSSGIGATDSSDIEGTLRGWFQDLLGVDEVAPDDDFFALGGHSLIGVRLFAKIRNTYKVDLELAALFEYRTVGALAERIGRSQQAAVASVPSETGGGGLVAIQPKGSKPPIVLIHAVGGEVLYYEPLARALGSDQPLYAFQSKLANQAVIEPITIEELARSYVDEIQRRFPGGHHILGGHSFGGLVAFEMAQQLLAQGLEPRALIMLDAVIPGCSEIFRRSTQVANLWGNLRNGGLTYLARKLRAKRIYLTEQYVRRMTLTLSRGLQVMGRRLPEKLRYLLVEEAHIEAMSKYQFRPYGGDLQLIRATDIGVGSLSEERDPELGWGKLVKGKLSIYDVDAEHSNIVIEPYVKSVADQVRQILADTETNLHEPSRSEKKAPVSAAIPAPAEAPLAAAR